MVQSGFIILSIIIFSLMAFAFYRAIKLDSVDNMAFRKRLALPFGGFIAWLGYLITVSENEMLFNLDLPPRFAWMLVLPMIIIFSFFYFKQRDKEWIKNIPITWPVYFQSFRIFVELLIAGTVAQQILPSSTSYHGYNFDILMGISAPFVAYFIFSKSHLRKWAKAWNYLGIVMILFVAFIVATSIYFPHLWGATEPLVSFEFLKLPYLLLPAFLAPAGIFMHIFSLMQLRVMK